MAENIKPQKILCITKSTGGIAVYNRELATCLSADGHNIHVLCLSENREEYARELQANGLNATSHHMNRYSISVLSDLKVAWHIRTLIRNNSLSIVIAHGAKAGFLARLSCRLTATPVLYVLHSMPFLQRIQGRKAFFYRQVEKIGTALGGHLVALTQSMKKNIVDNKVAPASRIEVIYTGINPDALGKRRNRRESCQALGLDPDRPIVVWAGRLNRQKAPEHYLEAAEIILKAVPDAQFVLAGEGPLAPAVKELITARKLKDSVLMIPWQDDVAVMLSACNVYVMTSRWEGLPLSLLEAMAFECAVVATSVDGISEAIRDGKDGLLASSDDPAGIAKHVVRLLLDESQCKELARNARFRVINEYSVDRMTAQWNSLIAMHVSDSHPHEAN